MTDSNKRETYIDVAKGILMSLVVLVHVVEYLSERGQEWLVDYIGSFHMAAFFMVGGFFIKREDWNVFFRKKWRALICPFVCVYLFSFIVGYCVNLYFPGISKNEVSILNVYYSCSFTNGPIWFLCALFFSLFLMQLVVRVPKEWLRIIIVVTISAIGYYWNRYTDYRLPFFWGTGMTALVFVYLGSYVRKGVEMIENRWLLTALGLSGVLMPLLSTQSVCKMLNDNMYEMYVSVPVVLVYCISIIVLAKAIDSNRYLQFVGYNSIIYLSFQVFVLLALIKVCDKFGFAGVWETLFCYVVSMVILAFVVKFVRRYLGFIFG